MKDVSAIDHPIYYNLHPTGVECIDIIEYFTFNLGNAMKYIWRVGVKSDSPVEDLEKAIWYLRREVALIKANE